jgi:succinate dehydrogenase / fumarate reductase cytochrome b subunit
MLCLSHFKYGATFMKPVLKQQHNAPLSPRLSIYRWRLTMLASIAHRGSGAWLVLSIPIMLWLLLTMSHHATAYQHGFQWLHHPLGMAAIWLTATAFFYHFFNGIRFLLLDAGFGESRDMMKLSAKIVLALTTLFAVVLAVAL